MDLVYLGHSSFLLSTKKTSLVIDPFDPQKTGLKFSKVAADIVTISHHHDDHDKADLVDNVKKVIDGPGEYEIEGISIIGISSFHDNKKGEERGKNTIYVYEAEGLRLCHLGDLGHELNEAALEIIGNVDVLMIPVGGVYTIDAEIAVKVARSIEPKITVPMHYQVKGLNLSNKLSEVDEFVKVYGIEPEERSKLSIKEGALLEESQQVIILAKK